MPTSKLPELDARENSWVVYHKRNKGCVETICRKYAERALARGQIVVTISQHLAAVQADVDAGGNGTNAKNYLT